MVMKQNELFQEIVRIVGDADGLSAALHSIQSLLAAEWGGAILIIRPASSALSFPHNVCEFLESRDFPFRGLYTAPLKTGAASAGTLVACIGTWGTPGEVLRSVT